MSEFTDGYRDGLGEYDDAACEEQAREVGGQYWAGWKRAQQRRENKVEELVRNSYLPREEASIPYIGSKSRRLAVFA